MSRTILRLKLHNELARILQECYDNHADALPTIKQHAQAALKLVGEVESADYLTRMEEAGE